MFVDENNVIYLHNKLLKMCLSRFSEWKRKKQFNFRNLSIWKLYNFLNSALCKKIYDIWSLLLIKYLSPYVLSGKSFCAPHKKTLVRPNTSMVFLMPAFPTLNTNETSVSVHKLPYQNDTE